MARPSRGSVGRRGFLKKAAAGAAAIVSAPAAADAIQQNQQGDPAPARADVYTTDKPGSDFMVDVIKSLDFEYVAANPGSTFRGTPRVVHQLRRQQEPRAADVLPRGVVGGHGARLRQDRRQADDGDGARHRRPAARVDGDLQRLRRPRAGLHRARQHRSTSRGAAATSSGRTPSRTPRRWCATTPSGTTRRCRSAHFARIGRARLQDRDDAAVRARSCSSPTRSCRRKRIPAADRGRLRVPKLSMTTPPAADAGAVTNVARMLVAAENPVIMAGRAARTPKGIDAARRARRTAAGAGARRRSSRCG